MIRFTVTRNMYEGDTYITQVELESQSQFDAWIADKSSLIGEVYSVSSVNVDFQNQVAAVKQARIDAYKAQGLDLMKLLEYISEGDTQAIQAYKDAKTIIQAANPYPEN